VHRPLFHALLATLLWGLLTACGSENPSAEGPSTETSGINARILDRDGKAISGVRVQAVARDGHWRTLVAQGGSPVLAAGLTDDQGRVHLSLPSGTKAMLELSDTVLAGRMGIVAGSDSLHDLVAEDGVRLRVRTSGGLGTIHALRLAQTGYQASRQADGNWLFAGIARGGYSVVARTDSGIALLGQVDLAAPSLDTLLAPDIDSVLLEDFSGAQLRNRYGALLGSGWWFLATDSANGGSSSTTPSRMEEARAPCSDGFCLDVGFHLDPLRTSRWAMVGVELDGSKETGDTSRSADLSRISHVRFRAAGGGNLLFQLAVLAPSGEVTACHAPIALGADLATIEVPLSSLSCDAPVSDYRHVYGMTWTAISDGHLTLGRIWLVGAGPQAVFRGLSFR